MDNNISNAIQILWALLTTGGLLMGIGGWNLLKYSAVRIVIVGLGLCLFLFSGISLLWIYFGKSEPNNLIVGIIVIVVIIPAMILYYREAIRRALNIDISETESKSHITNRGAKHIFEVSYVLRTMYPPVHITKVSLHFENAKLRAKEPDFTLDNAGQIYTSIFESSEDIQPWKETQNTYHLSMLALRTQPWISKEFKIHQTVTEFDVPTVDIRLATLPVAHVDNSFIKPKLKVLNAEWSSNRGISGGTWWLKVENQGIDYAESTGILEQIELANPRKDQSMAAYPHSCSLIWGGSNPIPGKCTSMLDVIYREPRTLSNYHYGIACSSYNRKGINLPTGRDILLVISITAKDMIPLYTVCYFYGNDSDIVDKFEILANNLEERPTIDECRELLRKYDVKTDDN